MTADQNWSSKRVAAYRFDSDEPVRQLLPVIARLLLEKGVALFTDMSAAVGAEPGGVLSDAMDPDQMDRFIHLFWKATGGTEKGGLYSGIELEPLYDHEAEGGMKMVGFKRYRPMSERA